MRSTGQASGRLCANGRCCGGTPRPSTRTRASAYEPGNSERFEAAVVLRHRGGRRSSRRALHLKERAEEESRQRSSGRRRSTDVEAREGVDSTAAAIAAAVAAVGGDSVGDADGRGVGGVLDRARHVRRGRADAVARALARRSPSAEHPLEAAADADEDSAPASGRSAKRAPTAQPGKQSGHGRRRAAAARVGPALQAGGERRRRHRGCSRRRGHPPRRRRARAAGRSAASTRSSTATRAELPVQRPAAAATTRRADRRSARARPSRPRRLGGSSCMQSRHPPTSSRAEVLGAGATAVPARCSSPRPRRQRRHRARPGLAGFPQQPTRGGQAANRARAATAISSSRSRRGRSSGSAMPRSSRRRA